MHMYIYKQETVFIKWKILLLNVESWDEVSVTTGRNYILLGEKKNPNKYLR